MSKNKRWSKGDNFLEDFHRNSIGNKFRFNDGKQLQNVCQKCNSRREILGDSGSTGGSSLWIQQVYLGSVTRENEFQGSLFIPMHHQRFHGIYSLLHQEYISVLHRICHGGILVLRRTSGDIPGTGQSSIWTEIWTADLWNIVFGVPSIKFCAMHLHKLDSIQHWILVRVHDQWRHVLPGVCHQQQG